MRVRARARGYYGALVRRPGDVFTLTQPQDFSKHWMCMVPADTPESRTTAQEAMRMHHGTRSPLGAVRHVDPAVDPDDDRPVDFEFDPFV